MNILRGTQIPIVFTIKDSAGTALTPTELSDVEITIGNSLRKTYSDGYIDYVDNKWVAKLTQKDTFSLELKEHPMIFRIKLAGADNWIFGNQFDTAFVAKGNTEVTL